MLSAYAIGSCCSPTARRVALAPSTISVRTREQLRALWRRCSLRSPETSSARLAPLRPLIIKELRGVLSGRALWTMLLILCPLVGYSFFQAVALYSEASSAAANSPALASGLSPLDG